MTRNPSPAQSPRRSLRWCVLLLAMGLPRAVPAQSPTQSMISKELQALFEADQEERLAGQLSPEHDRARLARARHLLQADSLVSAEDYY